MKQWILNTYDNVVDFLKDIYNHFMTAVNAVLKWSVTRIGTAVLIGVPAIITTVMIFLAPPVWKACAVLLQLTHFLTWLTMRRRGK